MSASILPPARTSSWLPAASPMIYTVSATALPGATPMVIIGIYINDEKVADLKYPEKLTGVEIDIHDIVINYLNPLFTNNLEQPLTGQTTMWCKVGATVREQYINASGETITTSESLPAINYAWLAAAEWNSDPSLFINDFETTSGQPGRACGPKAAYDGVWTVAEIFPMADRTYHKLCNQLIDNQYVVRDDSQITLTIPITSSNFYVHNLVVYSEVNGKLMRKATKQLTITDTNTDKFYTIPIGVNELNNFAWDTEIGFADYLIESDVSRYVIYLTRQAPTEDITNMELPMTQPITISIDRCRADDHRILYYSSEGGWWQINAHKKHFKSLAVKTNLMTNTFYKTPTASMRYKEPTSIQAEETFILNTDWLSEQHQIAEIEDMLTSTNLYIIHDNQYIPVTLTDSSYVIGDLEQDGLIQYELTFTAAYNKPTLI